MHHLILAIVTIFLACGSAEDNEETPEFVSNSDFQEDSSVDLRYLEDDNTNLASGSEDEENYQDEELSESLCLVNCSTPKEANFSFDSKPREIGLDNCDIYNFSMTDVGFGMRFFLQADCGNGTQLYFLDSSYDGSVVNDGITISEYCSDNFFDVIEMTVADNDMGTLALYTCMISAKKSETYSVLINQDGSFGKTNLVSSKSWYFNTTSDNLRPRYQLAWNSKADMFGLAKKSEFLRLDSEGFPIGGKVSISNPYKEVSGVHVINENWHILQASTSNLTYCSKISEYGLGECDNKGMEIRNGRIFEADKVLGVDKSSGDLYFAPFTSETCTLGQSKIFASVKEGKIKAVHNHILIAEDYSALLMEVEHETLILGLVNTKDGYRMDSQISVITGNNITQAQTFLAKDKILVSYIDNNRIFLTYSTQDVGEKM